MRWVSRCSSSTQAKLKFCGSTLTFEIWVFRPWCPLWQTFFSTFFRRKIKTLLSKEREHQGCGAWQWRGPRWRGRFRLWQAPNSNCDLATKPSTVAENHFQTFPKEERHGKTERLHSVWLIFGFTFADLQGEMPGVYFGLCPQRRGAGWDLGAATRSSFVSANITEATMLFLPRFPKTKTIHDHDYIARLLRFELEKVRHVRARAHAGRIWKDGIQKVLCSPMLIH